MAGAIPRQRFIDLNQLSLSLHVGGFSAEILGWGFFEPRWWRNYLHSHSCFEICYAFAGRGTFRMLDTEYTVRAGDVFVAKPGEPHEIVSSEEEPLGIYFWSHTLLPATQRHTAFGGSDALLHAFRTTRQWVSDRVEAMQPTLDLLVEEIVRKQPGYVQVIDGLVVKLLLDTARAVVDVPIMAEPAARGAADALAHQIAAYLRDNYSRPIAIRDVAAQVHLSERHTSRLFRETMGASIKSYLTALRLEVATQLLLDRHLSIQAVALASGYPDTRYFTTLFRRYMGSTPGRFRHTEGTQILARSG